MFLDILLLFCVNLTYRFLYSVFFTLFRIHFLQRTPPFTKLSKLKKKEESLQEILCLGLTERLRTIICTV